MPARPGTLAGMALAALVSLAATGPVRAQTSYGPRFYGPPGLRSFGYAPDGYRFYQRGRGQSPYPLRSPFPGWEGMTTVPPPTPIDNRARVAVRVPPDAEVWVDGQPTRQAGPNRVFVSPELKPARKYVYQVRARWKEGGAVVEETRPIAVWANRWSTIDFRAPHPQAAAGLSGREGRGAGR